MDLYNSKANIASFRKSAPQIHPNVARMFPTTGMEDVGKAISEIGKQQHQINVTRQVTNAMAQYKLRSVEFMSKMANSDPSKVNFDNEWSAFMKQQGDLTKGMSRDATMIMEEKMTMLGVDDYTRLKRQEISNTRDLVTAEAPEVMDGLLREQAKLTIAGDKERAAMVEEEFDLWLKGVAPALRPGESTTLKHSYKEGLHKALQETEKQMVYAQIHANPDAALEMIDNLKYTPPDKQHSLRSAVGAKKVHEAEMLSLLEDELINEQSAEVAKGFIENGQAPLLDNAHPDVAPVIDALNEKAKTGHVDVADEDLHINYYNLRNKLSLANSRRATPVVPENELMEALLVLPREKVAELWKQNEENKQLMPRLNDVRVAMRNMAGEYDKMASAVATKNRFNEEDTLVLLRELNDEKEVILGELKQKFIDGEDNEDIRKWAKTKLEPTAEGIMRSDKIRWLIPKKWEFTKDMNKILKSGPERANVQAIINLLQAGDYDREIEALLDIAEFTE